MTAFPTSLVTEIAERRCVIFLGAGITRSCVGADGETRPPSWRELLSKLLELVNDEATKSVADQLITEDKFLEAGEIILHERNVPELTRIMNDLFKIPRFTPTSLHSCIRDLDQNTVITTNYDEVYDHFCLVDDAEQGYRVCKYHESHAVDVLRSDQRLILKAHGCISQPRDIVLSRSDYFDAKRKFPEFYKLLDALFLTHTIMFLGCSLDDPDIQLVLENANIAAKSEHPHYALLPSGIHTVKKSQIRRTYNIEVLEYDNTDGTHAQLDTLLQEVVARVNSHRAV